jgi:putative hydrolase of the HAD superfamily
MGFDFDREKYWSHIRGDPADFLEANFDALEMLRAFPGMKKIVLTNCAEKQAIEALQVLGLEGEFDAVYGADFMGDVCKPERAAFEAVCARAKIDPHGTAFFEDSLKNLVTAKEIGFTTVLVSGKTAAEESGQNGGFTPDATISAVNLKELREALPGLFIGA